MKKAGCGVELHPASGDLVILFIGEGVSYLIDDSWFNMAKPCPYKEAIASYPRLSLGRHGRNPSCVQGLFVVSLLQSGSLGVMVHSLREAHPHLGERGDAWAHALGERGPGHRRRAGHEAGLPRETGAVV